MTFGEFMKKARKASKISQRDLAKKVGVAKHSICRYETDRVAPQIDMAEKIANCLGFKLKFEMMIGGEADEEH